MDACSCDGTRLVETFAVLTCAPRDASQTLLRRLSLTHRLSLHFNEEGVDEDPEGFED